MATDFKDHFSSHAGQYARSRPTYPAELFDYLVSLTNHHDLAWDCATGNGQAAVALAGRFARVIATDASAAQVANTVEHPNVVYLVATAEHSGLSHESVDLITVAQALHWFDFPAFFNEADRVLKEGGVLAAWAYEMFHISPALDDIIAEFYSVTLQDYWPPERRHIENGYADIPFSYPLLSTPAFEIKVQWSAEQIAAYLSSWSAVQKFTADWGFNPVERIFDDLRKHADPLNQVVWPLTLKVGRKA